MLQGRRIQSLSTAGDEATDLISMAAKFRIGGRPAMYLAAVLRSLMFSLVLGFHNAFEHDAAGFDERARRRATVRPWLVGHHPLNDPARCFFWQCSSLLN
jgi:hypothetical protein